MNKFLISAFLILLFSFNAKAQSCPGDVVILEDENLEVWQVTNSGNQILSLAAFQNTVNVGGTDFTQTDTGFGEYGVLIMSHDITGTFQWARQINGIGFFVTKPALATNGNNAIVAVTEVNGNDTIQNFRIESFSLTDGTPGWARSIPVNVSTSNLPFQAQINPYHAIADSIGNYVIAGAFSGPVTIGAANLNTTAGLSESFAMSINSATGVDNWAIQTSGSSALGRAWTVELETGTNNIILGGRFSGTIDFGNGVSFIATDSTTKNPYVAKINAASGIAQWVFAGDGLVANSFNNVFDITTDGVGNIYFAGSFNGQINFQGTVLTSAGNVDALIGAIDTNGNRRWINQLGGASTNDEFATTINYGPNSTSLFIGAQLVTDSVYYANTPLNLPPLDGHYVFGVSPLDGSIDPIPANNISYENNLGYSTTYFDGGPSPEYNVMASLIKGTGTNIKLTQWIPNRPIPIPYVTIQDGILNPSEFLTAFNPGASVYTYQWYLNNNPISVQIGDTLTALLNGKYSVEVANPNGCSVFSKEILLLDGSTLESDSLVLVDLFNNTNGVNWNNRLNWLSGNVNTWNGITVNAGRVIDISLSGNNMVGALISSIGNLTALQSIDLSSNAISGNLPLSFWDIPNLTVVQLCCGNSIIGTIPPTVGLLNLSVLDLGGNNFTGELPVELYNNTNLEFINLWDDADNGMNLTGTIPATIGNLSLLNSFSLNGNQISGTIPTEIGNASNLTILNLSDNQLTGPLPISLGNLALLNNLELRNNPINGTVPVELANLTSLITLSMENCQLQGVFPDSIWQIPTLQGLQIGANNQLEVILPTNLASLTQLTDIRIDNTLPKGGAFPADFYSLTNLVGLSLGNKQYTGSLDSRVGNWTQLDNIYLWNNFLEGAFPTEIIAASGLRALNVFNNNFTSFPDLSGLINLQELDISRNQLDFDGVAPNIGITGVLYNPQKQRGANQFLEVNEAGNLDLINTYSAAGNTYQWYRNINDSIATTVNYTITNANKSDLGGYFATVVNSSVPDLKLQTLFYNVAFAGAPKSWSVDNSAESLADFKTLYAAIYGTNGGDTLYVAGSATDYNVGGLRLDNQRIIYGPGYFLNENSETQANALEAKAPYINLAPGSSGTQIYGMNFEQIFVNNQSSSLNDTTVNIQITGNKIGAMGIIDDVRNILINKNYINNFTLSSTPLLNVSRSYVDINIEQNIIDTVASGLSRVNATQNVMSNVNFNRNTINIFLDSIQDANLNDNIINNYQATGNTVNNTRTYAAAGFINASGTLSIDNDFQTTNAGFNAGAYSGSTPYKLSGIGNVPHIYSITDQGRIKFNLNAKNESNSSIKFLNYRIGNNGNVLLKGTVKRLIPGNPVEVLFRPKVSTLPPGGTYNMMIWAKDQNGLKSTSHNVQFVAETTTTTGNITTSTDAPVTSGELLLFEINQEGNAFDTVSTILDNQGKFTLANVVIGDYLALGKGDTTQFANQLPTYYNRIDLWEEADTLLIDANNNQFNIKLIEKPKELTGDGTIAGILEEEIIVENSDGGRLEGRGRVKGAGVSMRRGRTAGKSEKIIYDLIEFVYTNDNGEFVFQNLPVDNYRINIQYPGYPMDTLSNVDIKIEATKNNAYNLAALVDKGKISVTILSTTGILQDIIKTLHVYPNPSIENINIEFNNDVELNGNITANLVSSKGDVVFNGHYNGSQINKDKRLSIPVSIYEPGVYLLNIIQGNKDLGTVRLMIIK